MGRMALCGVKWCESMFLLCVCICVYLCFVFCVFVCLWSVCVVLLLWSVELCVCVEVRCGVCVCVVHMLLCRFCGIGFMIDLRVVLEEWCV